MSILTRKKFKKQFGQPRKLSGGKDEQMSRDLTDKIVQYLDEKFAGKIPTVEQIQDIVEKVLTEEGHYQTVKSYMLYREKRSEARADKQVVVNVENTISEYLNKFDWRVKANSNQGYRSGE